MLQQAARSLIEVLQHLLVVRRPRLCLPRIDQIALASFFSPLFVSSSIACSGQTSCLSALRSVSSPWVPADFESKRSFNFRYGTICSLTERGKPHNFRAFFVFSGVVLALVEKVCRALSDALLVNLAVLRRAGASSCWNRLLSFSEPQMSQTLLEACKPRVY